MSIHEEHRSSIVSCSSLARFLTERLHSVKRNLLVAISGIGAAGKSTLTRCLSDHLRCLGTPLSTFAIDGFLHPRHIRHANPDQAAGFYNETFDFKTLFEGILAPLRMHFHLDTFMRILDEPRDWPLRRDVHIRGPKVILVEGVFLLRKDLRDIFDYKIWIDVDFEEALERALRRPRDLRKYGSPEAILRRYEERFHPGYRLHFDIDGPVLASNLVLTPLLPNQTTLDEKTPRSGSFRHLGEPLPCLSAR